MEKKLQNLPRGSSIYSPLFSACGVREILLEFYPNGSQNTTKDGFCAFYLRCPEGTSIVVTLFVGNFKKGPIVAHFDGSAGKGRFVFFRRRSTQQTVCNRFTLAPCAV